MNLKLTKPKNRVEKASPNDFFAILTKNWALERFRKIYLFDSELVIEKATNRMRGSYRPTDFPNFNRAPAFFN
ncbi:MAG: hypothetical protein MUC97_17635 [Bernardetiaceae bacterium]|jgi:hypothetical protein|nr:hypothetical protein [Bernardetiaceae bacterium]